MRTVLNRWEMAYNKENFYRGIRILLELERNGSSNLYTLFTLFTLSALSCCLGGFLYYLPRGKHIGNLRDILKNTVRGRGLA